MVERLDSRAKTQTHQLMPAAYAQNGRPRAADELSEAFQVDRIVVVEVA